MKILLDECLPVDLRHDFSEHEAHTAQWAGLKGRKNGDLLRAAENAGYDVLSTVDQGGPHQLPGNCRISIIVVGAKTNQLEDLLPLLRSILDAMQKIRPGQIISIAAT